MRFGKRHYPSAEFERVEGRPMEPRRLVAIWRSLPEAERLPFVLALEEDISYRVIELANETSVSDSAGR